MAIFESIKALEVKTSVLFNLDFANDLILSCLFLHFLFIDLNVLIPAIIIQIFNLIAELVIPIGVPTKESKGEMEIHPVIVEFKIRECSI